MTEQIKLPGGRGGTSGPKKIKVYAAVPHDGGDAIILNWEEETPLFGSYVEQIMSTAACDYGLDEPPSKGVWVFEGELEITGYQSNHPLDPPEWDTCENWKGEWRPPTDDELKAWGQNRPKLVGKAGPAPVEPDKPVIEQLPPKTGIPSYYASSPRRTDDFCVCGKHVSECCCGEDHNIPHHPSGRAYDEEEWEQFEK